MSPIHPGNCSPAWGRKAWRGRASVFLSIASFALIAASIPVQADTISGGGSWQTWNSATLSSSGSGPYWNNVSSDPGNANVGFCLAGGGSCSIPSAPGALSFYGSGNAAVSSIFFSGSGATVTVTFLGGISADANTFGWYSVNPANPNVVPAAASQHVLASNVHTATPTAVGQTMTFAAGSDYGFYLNNGSQTFFSQSSLNADNYQHFAVFTDGTSFYIGAEDTFNGGDRDFNDMLVKVTPSAPGDPTDVPEPVSMSMLGGGLLLLGGIFRFTKRSR